MVDYGSAHRANWDRRNLVLEALSALGPNATRDQVVELLESDLADIGQPAKSVGKMLANLTAEGYVREEHGRYTLLSKSPVWTQNGALAAQTYEGEATKLSEYQQNREKQTVTLYQSPVEIEDAVAVWVKYEQSPWFKVPLFGSLRICLGPGIPKWSPSQETNRGITQLRVVRQNGETLNMDVNSQYPITFAGEE